MILVSSNTLLSNSKDQLMFNYLRLIFCNVWSQATESTTIRHFNITITQQSSNLLDD